MSTTAGRAEQADLVRDHRVDQVGVGRGRDLRAAGQARAAPGRSPSRTARRRPARTATARSGSRTRSGSFHGSSQMSIRSWTWLTVLAKNHAPTTNSASPASTNESAAGRDVEQRQEGAEEHQRAAEVADEDEHQHRRAPHDQQRPEVLQRRDRHAQHAPRARPPACRRARAGSWPGRRRCRASRTRSAGRRAGPMSTPR